MNRPYNGAEPYIFISYSHRDSQQVMPIIAQLQSQGYRVWYDEGIDPGTEWDENIAAHISGCGYLIAFLSANYLRSDNCKDELNFARDLNKERLLVYLEDVQLPPGMAMRLNRLQAIHKYTYADEAAFYEKLYLAQGIAMCLGAPTPAAAKPAKKSPSLRFLESISGRLRKSKPETPSAPAKAASPNPTQQFLQQIGDIPDEAYLQSITRAADEDAPVNTAEATTATASAPPEPTPDPTIGFVIENSVLTKYMGKEESVVIPSFITRIGTRAFEHCTHVKRVHFPAVLKSIGLHAFEGCTGLTAISLPDSVTKIADCAFCGCTALTEIHLPDSLTAIGAEAFRQCSSLREIRIPASVSSVPMHTFRDCTSLTTVWLPANVSVSSYEFEGCSNLKTIYLSRNTKLDRKAFRTYHNGVECIITD